MVTYVVGEAEHQVDHPPLFACREHKNLLRFSPRFVDELLTTSQDVMPGNPDEIAQAFLRDAAPAYRLPEFLIPPKLFLFNPRGLRGAEALPYSIVLIDRKFFGIPARYLTPDRFDGCDECAQELASRRPSSQQPRPAGAPPSGVRGPGPPGPTNQSGVRRMPTPPPGLNESGAQRRAPDPGSGARKGPPPASDGQRPGSGPVRPGAPRGQPGRPGPRPPAP